MGDKTQAAPVPEDDTEMMRSEICCSTCKRKGYARTFLDGDRSYLTLPAGWIVELICLAYVCSVHCMVKYNREARA